MGYWDYILNPTKLKKCPDCEGNMIVIEADNQDTIIYKCINNHIWKKELVE